MRKTILAILAMGLLLPATSCTLTRGEHGRLIVEHTSHSARGQYRPWCDINSGGLPSFWYGCSNWGAPYDASPGQWTTPYMRKLADAT